MDGDFYFLLGCFFFVALVVLKVIQVTQDSRKQKTQQAMLNTLEAIPSRHLVAAVAILEVEGDFQLLSDEFKRLSINMFAELSQATLRETLGPAVVDKLNETIDVNEVLSIVGAP